MHNRKSLFAHLISQALPLWLLLPLLVACKRTSDTSLQWPEANPTSLSLSFVSENDPRGLLLPEEKTIESLHAVVFEASTDREVTERAEERFLKVIPAEHRDDSYIVPFEEVDAISPHNYLIIFVANAPQELLRKIGSVANRAEMQKIAIEAPATGKSPIMVSKPMTQRVYDYLMRKVKTPYLLERLISRIDIQSELPEGTALTTATVEGLIDRTLLGGHEAGKVKTDLTTRVIKLDEAKIYTYGFPREEEVTLTIDGTYKGKEISPIKIRISALKLLPNKVYTLSLKPKKENSDPTDANFGVVVTLIENDLSTGTSREVEGLEWEQKFPPKTPLSYLAEYPITEEGMMATEHTSKSCGFFDLEMARSLSIEGYHFPTDREWASIFPPGTTYLLREYFTEYGDKNSEISESMVVAGKEVSSTAEYGMGEKDFVLYGLRYKTIDLYRSAWRYERMESPFEPGGYVLKITSLPVDEKTTLDMIKKDEFWEAQSANVVTRYLVAAGQKYYDVRRGAWRISSASAGYYLCDRGPESGSVFLMKFDGQELKSNQQSQSTRLFTLYLFAD